MSGAQFVGDEAVQASGKDGDEGDLDEGDEMFLRPLEDDVQPTVAAQPCERPLNHPADAGRNEASIAAAGNGLDGDAESLAGFRQPLAPVAEIPQRLTLEASVGELAQNRDNSFRVMPICRRNIDPQRKAVFVHGDMDLDALDLLSAVNASVETARRRAAGSAVDNHGARFRSIPTSAPPVAVQPAEQPPPEAEPGPAGEQPVEGAEGDGAQQSDCPPLHAAGVDAPDRHSGLPHLRRGQWRLRPGSLRPGAVPPSTTSKVGQNPHSTDRPKQ